MTLIPPIGYAAGVRGNDPTFGVLPDPSPGIVMKRNCANGFDTPAGAAAEMNEAYSFVAG
jgi:hypothetical protein